MPENTDTRTLEPLGVQNHDSNLRDYSITSHPVIVLLDRLGTNNDHLSMRWLLLLIVLLNLCGASLADEVLLVKTRNDLNERDDSLHLELDEDGHPIELVHRVYDDIVMGVFQPKALARGVTLRRHGGKDILRLRISGFQASEGASATLTYLADAIPFSRYNSMKFTLRKHLGDWRLFQVGDERPIKMLFFRANFSNLAGIHAPTGVKQIRVIRDRK